MTMMMMYPTARGKDGSAVRAVCSIISSFSLRKHTVKREAVHKRCLDADHVVEQSFCRDTYLSQQRRRVVTIGSRALILVPFPFETKKGEDMGRAIVTCLCLRCEVVGRIGRSAERHTACDATKKQTRKRYDNS